MDSFSRSLESWIKAVKPEKAADFTNKLKHPKFKTLLRKPVVKHVLSHFMKIAATPSQLQDVRQRIEKEKNSSDKLSEWKTCLEKVTESSRRNQTLLDEIQLLNQRLFLINCNIKGFKLLNNSVLFMCRKIPSSQEVESKLNEVIRLLGDNLRRNLQNYTASTGLFQFDAAAIEKLNDFVIHYHVNDFLDLMKKRISQIHVWNDEKQFQNSIDKIEHLEDLVTEAKSIISMIELENEKVNAEAKLLKKILFSKKCIALDLYGPSYSVKIETIIKDAGHAGSYDYLSSKYEEYKARIEREKHNLRRINDMVTRSKNESLSFEEKMKEIQILLSTYNNQICARKSFFQNVDHNQFCENLDVDDYATKLTNIKNDFSNYCNNFVEHLMTTFDINNYWHIDVYGRNGKIENIFASEFINGPRLDLVARHSRWPFYKDRAELFCRHGKKLEDMDNKKVQKYRINQLATTTSEIVKCINERRIDFDDVYSSCSIIVESRLNRYQNGFEAFKKRVEEEIKTLRDQPAKYCAPFLLLEGRSFQEYEALCISNKLP